MFITRQRSTDYADHRQRGHLLLFSLLLVSIINLADRNIINLLLDPIAKDLGLSDSELGVLAGPVFGICYAAALIPIAHLADRWMRLWVISGALILWSALTAAQGLATSFLMLLLIRAGVAITESGSGPATNSIIADLYPPVQRSRAFAIYSIYSPVGFALGAVVAGYGLEHYGWRETLTIIGIPGVIFGVLLPLAFKEPLRGNWDNSASNESLSLLTGLRALLNNPTLRWLVAGQTVFIAGVAASNFDSVYLIRSHKLPPETIGTLLGAAGLLVGIGALLGGWVGDRFGGSSPERLMRLSAWFSVCTLPQLFVFYLAPNQDWLTVGIAMNSVTPGNFALLLATLQLLVLPAMRAKAAALLIAVSNGVGGSLGPLLVGGLSDATSAWLADESMRYAVFTTFAVSSLLAALCFWRAAALQAVADPINRRGNASYITR